MDPILITDGHLEAIAGRPSRLIPLLVPWINATCPEFGIDTPREYAHFLAQACHETDHFKTLEEYASGRAYEGRQDLGNTHAGDGVRYKGRGIFQTTGRANYRRLGEKIGQPDQFIDEPDLLEQPELAVWSACLYWQDHRFNDIASHADSDRLNKKHRGGIIQVSPVEYISLGINGGYNGMDDRKRFYQRALEVLGVGA